jgi:hypothetical protein
MPYWLPCFGLYWGAIANFLRGPSGPFLFVATYEQFHGDSGPVSQGPQIPVNYHEFTRTGGHGSTASNAQNLGIGFRYEEGFTQQDDVNPS